MATQLTIVNNVLRRLREDTVTSVADNAYAQLIAMWVNDGMREVSNAHAWSSLYEDVEFDIVAGTLSYNIAKTVADGGAVVEGSATTEESMLAFDSDNRPLAFVYDTSVDTTSKARLDYLPEYDRDYRVLERDSSQTVEYPQEFGLDLVNAEPSGYVFKLWQKPSEAKYVRIGFWTPQEDLAIDGTADNTSVKAHNSSVEAYVHMVAANERGEEIGEPGNILERRYNEVLASAIEAAISKDMRANVYESRRD